MCSAKKQYSSFGRKATRNPQVEVLNGWKEEHERLTSLLTGRFQDLWLLGHCRCCLLAAMIAAQRAAAEGAVRGDNAPHAAVPAPPLEFWDASPAPALPGNTQHMLPPRVRSLPEPMGSQARSWAEGRKHQPAAAGAARPGPAAGEAAQRLGVFGAA